MIASPPGTASAELLTAAATGGMDAETCARLARKVSLLEQLVDELVAEGLGSMLEADLCAPTVGYEGRA